jgi:predicted RNA-binding Zn-ribbon protein involved in translation (DUF1610 family)
MPKRGRIDLTKVRASLASVCPTCGYEITPAEVQRVDGQSVRCPKCSAIFMSGKPGTLSADVG